MLYLTIRYFVCITISEGPCLSVYSPATVGITAIRSGHRAPASASRVGPLASSHLYVDILATAQAMTTEIRLATALYSCSRRLLGSAWLPSKLLYVRPLLSEFSTLSQPVKRLLIVDLLVSVLAPI